MSIKKTKSAMYAGAILAAFAMSGGAFAAGAAGDSFSFETAGTLGTGDYVAITGNGTFESGGEAASRAAGVPIRAAEHAQALQIAGTVAYTNSADSGITSGSSQVDFMFKVEPTDELENPTDSDIHVALAVGETNNAAGTTASIKLWCSTNTAASGTAQGWVTLTDSATVGAWMRATLVLDYSANRCQVSLEGDPMKAEGAVDGSWYMFAGTPAHNFVKSITMVGSTMIDDLVVSHNSLDNYNPYVDESGDPITVDAGTSGVEVPLNYINEYGVTKAQAEADADVSDGAGMTISQKYVAGLDPTSATKFELKTMNMTSATAATVTFPGANAASAYTVSVTTDAAGETPAAGVTVGGISQTGSGEKVNTVNLSNLPAEGTVYIHLKATK